MKKSKQIALSGVFTALCVVSLFLGSLFQSLDLSAAAFASLIVLVSFIELGKVWATGVYLASSLLSIILLPNKSAAVVFALFAGFYPIIKALLNRIKPIWLSYVVRVAFFNLMLTAIIFVATKVLQTDESFIGFGTVIYLLANLTFIVFDFALERIAATYISRIKPLIFRKR